jgi:hypothetical protein
MLLGPATSIYSSSGEYLGLFNRERFSELLAAHFRRAHTFGEEAKGPAFINVTQSELGTPAYRVGVCSLSPGSNPSITIGCRMMELIMTIHSGSRFPANQKKKSTPTKGI